MIKRKLLTLAMLLLPTLASANLVQNGDFEAGGADWTTTPTVGFTPVSTYISCCSGTGSYPAAPGAAFLGWGNTVGGTLSQTITTVIGQTYAVTFDHGAFGGTGSQQSLLASAFDGATTLGSTSASKDATLDFTNIVNSYTFLFTATSTLTQLMFADTSTITASTDGILDNVKVNAVPVPASLPLLLAGLGLIGYCSRKKTASLAN
jgi:hypothetical protein